MKANEAPERIWIDLATDLPKLSGHIDKDSVEYIRTDAFIEKAENFIYSALNDGIMGTCNIEDFLRLFINYMKEK